MNRINKITPAASVPHTDQCPQPAAGIRRHPYVNSASPSATVVAPRTSSNRPTPSALLSGTFRDKINNEATPNGMLMKNMPRHNPASANAPPNIGPPNVTVVVNADQVPIAFPRSFSSINAEISESEPGIINAPPAPWMTRQRISIVTDPAKPQAADPAIKITIPHIYTRFRPNLSPSIPPTNVNAANISRYAFSTQKSSVPSAPSDCCNAGNTTFNAVASIKAIEDAKTAAAINHRPVVLLKGIIIINLP